MEKPERLDPEGWECDHCGEITEDSVLVGCTQTGMYAFAWCKEECFEQWQAMNPLKPLIHLHAVETVEVLIAPTEGAAISAESIHLAHVPN